MVYCFSGLRHHAVVGSDSNIGAGTITCNYDGANKHQTTIEPEVFVGSGTELVAPVTIGRGAYIGAGSCITENVPANALALARGRQVIKEARATKIRKNRPARKSVCMARSG